MNFSFPGSSESLIPGVGVAWVLLVWILTAIVHIGFALAVLADAQLHMRRFRRRTFLVGGGLWALATLLGGVFVAAAYWFIHYSTLCPVLPPANPEPEPTAPRKGPPPHDPQNY